jgi:hypothetical protein
VAVSARSRCAAAPRRAAWRGRPSEFIESLCFCPQALAIRFARDVQILPVFNSIIARFHDVRPPAALVFEWFIRAKSPVVWARVYHLIKLIFQRVTPAGLFTLLDREKERDEFRGMII